MARVYTCMGKENVVTITDHQLRDGHLILHGPNDEADKVKYMITTGSPCCIKIDYEDINVDVYNEFTDCRICKCGEIVFGKSTSSVSVKRRMR